MEKNYKKLPEGLDEAAEEATKNKYPDESGLDDHDADAWYQSHRDHWRRAYKYGFKAGAEWRDAQIPKLPDNLDEVAEEFAERHRNNLGYKSSEHVEGFKAGAEWMAGRGVNADFKVCKLANRAWLNPIDEKRFMQDVFDNFADGDKVVVQIRKKNEI